MRISDCISDVFSSDLYIREMYQDNRLVDGSHRVRGRRVVLRSIRCPLLVIVAERDTICPPAAATALLDCCSSEDTRVPEGPGGHVENGRSSCRESGCRYGQKSVIAV